jgi:hypothetical protein
VTSLRVLCLTALSAFAAVFLPGADGLAAGLPADMKGTWGWEAQSCANPGDDGRVVVATWSVSFFAADYRLTAVNSRADGEVRGVAVTNEEGERSRSRKTIALRLIGPDRLSVRTQDADVHIYVRCASNAKPD